MTEYILQSFLALANYYKLYMDASPMVKSELLVKNL